MGLARNNFVVDLNMLEDKLVVLEYKVYTLLFFLLIINLTSILNIQIRLNLSVPNRRSCQAQLLLQYNEGKHLVFLCSTDI